MVLGQLSRSADLDVAAERLELEPGAAGADGEVEPVFRLFVELHREAGAEITVEGRDGDRHVRLFRDRYPHVAVMRPKAIAAPVLDRPVVRDVPVDGARFGIGGLDLNERDAAIHGFRGEVARDVRSPDLDRKSTRLNSSHGYISYAVFCLKKKKNTSAVPNAQC